MAGAYAKEFEKWLQGNKKDSESEDDDSADMDDSGDEIGNCLTDSAMKDQDEQAPVLNNQNGNAVIPRKRQHCFQDEPPILEPVPYVPSTKILSSKRSEDDFDGDEIPSKTLMDKIERVKDNQKIDMESEKYYHKSKDSENIFDKFINFSEVDDFPPPLIPSHEAHLTTVDAKDDDSFTEKSYATLQNLSPNFCAMEADSTSEMLKGNQRDSSTKPKERSSKTFVSNDIGVECDSTCMLGGSPQVVSPSSLSNVESDHQTPNREEASISADENPSISWNTFTTNETYHVLPPSGEQGRMENMNIESNMTSSYLENFITDSHNSVWDRDCPKLEAVLDMNEGKGTENHKRTVGHVEDPPILSVIPPTHPTSCMAVRKKRHTIDTVESIPKSKHESNSHDKESKHSIGCRTYPSTSHSKSVLDDKSSSSRGAVQKLSSSKRKESSSHTHSQNHSRPWKHRKRCQTLPIVDLISYGNHLPKDLYKFVVNSSQLYQLQSRMYQLVSLLFPQLSSDLNGMSPDSHRFETLLKDLFFYLGVQQGKSDRFDDTNDCILHSDESAKVRLNGRMPNQEKINLDSICTDEKTSKKTVSNLDETSDTDFQRELDPDFDLHQHSSANDLLSCERVKSSYHSVVTETIIPRLSALNLTKENEKILKCQPSVLICRNPSALHKNFFKLSCCILQQLLPDLGISLFCELAKSPNDLLHFIDSVITSNTC